MLGGMMMVNLSIFCSKKYFWQLPTQRRFPGSRDTGEHAEPPSGLEFRLDQHRTSAKMTGWLETNYYNTGLPVTTLNKSFKSSNSSSRMPNSSWSTLQMYSVISLLAFMVFFTWGSSVSGRPGWVLWLPDKHILLAEVTIWTRPDLWYFFIS